jgi:hypothetical protein
MTTRQIINNLSARQIIRSLVELKVQEILAYAGRDNYGRDPRDPTKEYRLRFKRRLKNKQQGSPGIQPFTKNDNP